MPLALERKLKKAARKFAGKKRRNAYVYGTLREIEKRHQAKGGKPGKYLKNV